jgi:hypothetical protein
LWSYSRLSCRSVSVYLPISYTWASIHES